MVECWISLAPHRNFPGGLHDERHRDSWRDAGRSTSRGEARVCDPGDGPPGGRPARFPQVSRPRRHRREQRSDAGPDHVRHRGNDEAHGMALPRLRRPVRLRVAGMVDLEFEDGQTIRLQAGESMYIPGGLRHNEIATSDTLETLEVSVPADMGTVPCAPPKHGPSAPGITQERAAGAARRRASPSGASAPVRAGGAPSSGGPRRSLAPVPGEGPCGFPPRRRAPRISRPPDVAPPSGLGGGTDGQVRSGGAASGIRSARTGCDGSPRSSHVARCRPQGGGRSWPSPCPAGSS